MINSFVKRMFIGLSDDELNRASGDDVINLFNQLIRKGRSIVSSKTRRRRGSSRRKKSIRGTYGNNIYSCRQLRRYTFEIMKQDVDEVIMIINYLTESGKASKQEDKLLNDKEQDHSFWASI